MPAKIVFLEGPNYCGKSTITKALVNLLDSEGKSFATTYEPGGDIFGEGIRNLLLSKELNDQCEMDYTCRRLLYASSHSQMLNNLKPLIESYDYIIIDRYNPISDLIYGPMEETDPSEWAKKMEKAEKIFSVLENEFMIPVSSLIFLDITEEVMKARDEKRSTRENKVYDYKSWEFKRAIRERYINLSEELVANPHCLYRNLAPFKNIYILNADGEAEEVANKIFELIENQEEPHAN